MQSHPSHQVQNCGFTENKRCDCANMAIMKASGSMQMPHIHNNNNVLCVEVLDTVVNAWLYTSN